MFVFLSVSVTVWASVGMIVVFRHADVDGVCVHAVRGCVFGLL